FRTETSCYFFRIALKTLKRAVNRHSLFRFQNKAASKLESHYGCNQDPDGIAPGTNSNRRSHCQPGAAGERTGTPAGQAASMAGRAAEKEGPSAGEQEQEHQRQGRRGIA